MTQMVKKLNHQFGKIFLVWHKSMREQRKTIYKMNKYMNKYIDFDTNEYNITLGSY